MLERIQPILLLLDQGLALYRRHFLSFALIAAGWFVPLAVGVAVLIAFSTEIGDVGVIAWVLLGAIIFFLLMLYLIMVLSRATAAVLDDRALHLRDILRFQPLRMVGVTVFSIIYFIIAQILSSTISLICICPAYMVGVVLIGATAAFSGSAGATTGILAFVAIFGLIYLLSIFISGAVYSGLIYGLQPWAQDGLGFGAALERSIDAMLYRFWQNLVTWGLAALLLTALGITLAVTIGIVLPLPLGLLLGFETPVVQAVTAGAWLFGLIFILPPLPIWMALLYRKNRSSREGMALQAKVDAWIAHSTVAPVQ